MKKAPRAPHLLLPLMLLLCASCIASTSKDSSMLIDKIPVSQLFSPQSPISEAQYPAQQAELVKTLNDQWGGKYKVISQRIYLYPSTDGVRPSWPVVDSYISNYIATTLHGHLETTKVTSAVPVMSEVWKVGTFHTEWVAIAMIDNLPDGNALVGYFEVEKP